MKYTETYKSNLSAAINIEHCFFDRSRDLLNQVKELLDQKIYVIIHVDLFYWLPELSMSGKLHIWHTPLLLGYDETDSTLLIFDIDNDFNYRLYKIPQQLLITSATMSTESFLVSKPKYDYIKLTNKSNIKPFELPFDQIKSNAMRLEKELSLLRSQQYDLSFLEPFVKSNLPLSLLCCTNFANRQVGNALLFNELYNSKYITHDEMLSFTELCKILSEKAQIIKSILIKFSLVENWFSFTKVLILWKEIYDIEYSLWKNFILTQ